MLVKNYITTAWRNMANNKLFTAINIFGLAIGLAACVMIMLYVQHETKYDQFWQNADTIHRAHVTFNVPGRDPMDAVSAPGPMIHALKKDFEQIEYATRIGSWGPTITYKDKVMIEDVRLVDPEFADMFDLTVLAGDVKASLNDNQSIVLSESAAKKFFGDKPAINEVLSLDFNHFQREYKVGAVIEDLPDNSQLDLPIIVAIDEKDWEEQRWMFGHWFSVNSQLYFKTKQASDLATISSQLDQFANNNFPQMPIGGDDAKASDFIKLSAMNIQDLHLKATGFGEMRPQGNQTMVITFSAVSFLILLIAAINFMNLSTAQASRRAKEVSLRKVMGASRRNLVVQFLGESVLLSVIAFTLAFALVELTLPLYNEVLNRSLSVSYTPVNIATFVAVALAVGVLSGLYPAFVLSNFRPATVLKANKSADTKASLKLRAGLVVVQFAISIGLFVSTAVVYAQMQYALNMDPGYNKDNLMVIYRVGRDAASEQRNVLLNELEKHPQVTSVTYSNETPGNANENNTMMRTPEIPEEDALLIGQRAVGYNFFETYQINVVAGRTYDKNRADITPSNEEIREGAPAKGAIVINESALQRLGLGTPEQALGKILITDRGDPGEDLSVELTVIGVVEDIHFSSLRATIRPEVYPLSADFGSIISVRFNGSPETIKADAEKMWTQHVPSVPFSYSYVDAEIAEFYQQEQGEAQLFATFSGLAIFIACLGLFGLASFTAHRKTKEIGIRKVMGASVFDIVRMLVLQFSKPVFIACLVAWPIACYLMFDWLQAFVYRIDTSLIILLCAASGVFALLIAWVTVAGNSIKVARSNPIKALRYE
ncbi:ABC transporter permease [Thalassotalea ponticola]|uniref:ABC transporter permease n=1 Tax=Thalassotalea ponticola TaxID=1523392 RepID=UPI0025B2AD79|nr:ABC transporter permease [Thalassotalea ponticola]MDN3651483.1 ABC transporter permease [Thalassotalea ponticola]